MIGTAGSSSTLVTFLAAVSPILATTIGVWLTYKLRQVHKIVNDKSEVQDARIEQLTAALGAAGIDVPAPTPKTGPPVAEHGTRLG